MNNPFGKAGIVVLVALVIFLTIWELTWRSKGFRTSYDDNAALWAYQRARVYGLQEKTTVFIGSSRIKFDLDIPTWEKLTGENVVQLAMVGSSPYLLLQDLADDPRFKGKLVIDITEPLYFSKAPPYAAKPREFVSHFHKSTPSERFSFEVSRRIEANFAFLDKEYLSINGLLSQVDLPRRPQVFLFPYFPHGFEETDFKRQSRMLDHFLKDTGLQQMQQRNWLTLFEAAKQFPRLQQNDIDEVVAGTVRAIQKIKGRGGKVLFVRTPSSSPMWDGEQQGFPRERFWNVLLNQSNTPGIHFADYPETANFICPEWSHLSPSDAEVYTRHLVRQIAQKGWSLPNSKQAPEEVAVKN